MKESIIQIGVSSDPEPLLEALDDKERCTIVHCRILCASSSRLRIWPEVCLLEDTGRDCRLVHAIGIAIYPNGPWRRFRIIISPSRSSLRGCRMPARSFTVRKDPRAGRFCKLGCSPEQYRRLWGGTRDHVNSYPKYCKLVRLEAHEYVGTFADIKHFIMNKPTTIYQIILDKAAPCPTALRTP